MANVMDQLAARARVRVIKPGPSSDDRTMLCGEPMQKGFDEGGNEIHYFEIPAHQADYINSAFRKYKVTEPFLPGIDDATQAKLLEKPAAHHCPVEGCGKSFKTAAALQGHMSVHR